MTMYLLEYDLILKGKIHRLSARFPEIGWEVRPMGPRWLVRCQGTIEALRAFSRHTGVGDTAARGPDHDASFLYSPSRIERAFVDDAAQSGATVLPPLRWRGGRLTGRFASAHELPSRRWRLRYPGARLIRKRRAEPRELFDELGRPSDAIPSLTLRQAQILLAAVRLGYYEVPRRSTVDVVARGVGIARSTAEGHLRIAESAMICASAPLVEARERLRSSDARPSDASGLQRFAQYSAELGLFIQMAISDERIYRVSFHRTSPKKARTQGHPYLNRVLRHIASGTDPLDDLPVELVVTPFTRRVLEEVRRIPPGATRSYSEIARRLGEPKAARAVGNAVAGNPIPVVVPCHRVVPSGGGVGAYSGAGGSETKRRLLGAEGARPAEGVRTAK